MEALVAADLKPGDGRNGTPIAAGKPEWYSRVLSIIHDLEAAGREPGAVWG